MHEEEKERERENVCVCVCVVQYAIVASALSVVCIVIVIDASEVQLARHVVIEKVTRTLVLSKHHVTFIFI